MTRLEHLGKQPQRGAGETGGSRPVIGLIFDIQRFSVHDGPGIRTTVFFKGCPLRCRWCHNPEGLLPERELMLYEARCRRCGACVRACRVGAAILSEGQIRTQAHRCLVCGACVEACPSGVRQLVGWEACVDEVVDEIVRDRVFYEESGGGATFSGGEPLAQEGFLTALLERCKGHGIQTALDTCGHAPWAVLDRIRGMVDLFLYDLKLLDNERHRDFTGQSNELILSNLKRLSGLGHEIILRLPLVPNVNDDGENIRAIGRFAASLPLLGGLDVLRYHHAGVEKYGRLHKDYGLAETPRVSHQHLAEIVALLEGLGLTPRVVD
jgi:pyruvate formate lyase activating enzyme